MGLFDSKKKRKEKEEARRAEEAKRALQAQQQQLKLQEARKQAQKQAADAKSANTVDAMKQLKRRIEMWDKKIEVIEKDIEKVMQGLVQAQKAKKMNEFKRLGGKKALLEKRLNNTRAEQAKMQQALDTLETADSTNFVANTIESANTAIQETAVDMKRVEEITDKQEEHAQNVEEAQSYFTVGADLGEFDEDELMAEVAAYQQDQSKPEELILPSPPSNVPAVPAPAAAAAAGPATDDAEAEIRRIEAEMSA